MLVFLQSCGNPDHGQDPYLPVYGCQPRQWAMVETLREASHRCLEFISDNNLGSKNWAGGDVFEDDELVAHVSYNGRVWHPNGTEIQL